jgi:hypothetical protein
MPPRLVHPFRQSVGNVAILHFVNQRRVDTIELAIVEARRSAAEGRKVEALDQ